MGDTALEQENVILLEITHDEIIRNKVRAEISKQKDQSSNLWKFLNSSFGIWILSSILLSGLTLLYTNYSAFKVEQTQAQARLFALKDEISYRLDSDLVTKIFDASGQGSTSPQIFHVAVLCLPADQFGAIATSGGIQASAVPNFSLQPTLVSSNEQVEKSLLAGRFIHTEFRNRSIFSLVWELQQREDNPAQVEMINNALEAISSLRRDALSGSGTKPALEYLEPVEAMIESWN